MKTLWFPYHFNHRRRGLLIGRKFQAMRPFCLLTLLQIAGQKNTRRILDILDSTRSSIAKTNALSLSSISLYLGISNVNNISLPSIFQKLISQFKLVMIKSFVTTNYN